MRQSLALVCQASTDKCEFTKVLSDPQGVAPISEEQLETYILQHLDDAQQRWVATTYAVSSLKLACFLQESRELLAGCLMLLWHLMPCRQSLAALVCVTLQEPC